MRFLLDEDLTPAVAEIGRGQGLDIVSVHEIDRRGLTDEEQLRFAAREARLLVTRNRDDFIRLTVACFHASEPHPDVLIVPRSLPNRQPERIAAAIARWFERHGTEPAVPYLIDFLGI